MPFEYQNKGAIDFKKAFATDANTLKDKHAFVTGGASGLGEAFVRQLVKLGAFVTIADISDEKGKQLTEELKPNAQFVNCDVTSFKSQTEAFESAIKSSPNKSLDYVLANAGIGSRDTAFDPEDVPTEPALGILNVNLTGVIYTSKLALHYFRTTGGDPKSKCLLITSSLAGYLDLPTNPMYTVSKFGARAVMRCLRWTSPYRVNVLAPWFIQTPIMPAQTIGMLDAAGIGWATLDDAAKGVARVLADTEIDGRGVGVVPEDVVPEGLVDLEMDDYENQSGSKSEWTGKWLERLLHLHKKLEEMHILHLASKTK